MSKRRLPMCRGYHYWKSLEVPEKEKASKTVGAVNEAPIYKLNLFKIIVQLA